MVFIPEGAGRCQGGFGLQFCGGMAFAGHGGMALWLAPGKAAGVGTGYAVMGAPVQLSIDPPPKIYQLTPATAS